MRCPSCGEETGDGARFCASCGTALDERVAVAERRTVTALFADLVSSTGMGERLDPEVVRGYVSRFFERAAAEVRARGGTVEKFSGDAVMALFGLQAAHEDDPERAVRAGFAIQDALGELASEAEARHGISLSARIGIESGEVVVGDPFGGATMATGDPLNLAARLEQHAEVGEIVVGPHVHEATSRSIRQEPAGRWELRGKAEPVEAWRAIEAIAAVGEGRGIEGLSAPLTGRGDEMALLRDAARRARSGSKAVLATVVGVPGVGKSRLGRELGAWLEAEGWQVLHGRCLPYGDGITYWPVAEIVRSMVGITPDLDRDAALAGLRSAAPDSGTADRLAFAIGLTSEAPVGGEGLDREIAWAFRMMVEAAASERPLMVVIEDIHWAEPVLLDLIEYLATWVRDRPLMILCLSRPELVDARPAWGSGRMEASRLQLEPLGREDGLALVAALLHVEGLPEALRDRILDRAEGNPLFVEETIRMLIDRRAVVERDGRWVAGEAIAEIEVPETIEALIRARLDGVPPGERAVLQAASVIGRSFQRSAVATLVEAPVERALEEAILRDMITEEPAAEPGYRFKHVLIRDVAYAALPKARRAELHRRLVDWIRDRAGERLDELVEIEAYHLEQAAHLQRELEGRAEAALVEAASRALERSAQKAIDREDLRAVVGFAERALDLEPGSGERRMEIEMLLLQGLHASGDLRRARELGERLAEAAGRSGRHDLRGRALHAMALDVWMGLGHAQGLTAGVALLNEARTELENAGDREHLADVVFDLAFEGHWLGDVDRSLAGFQAAAELARELDDAAREVRALTTVANAHVYRGEVAEADRVLSRAMALSPKTSRLSQARVWLVRGNSLFWSGRDPDEGRALVMRVLQVAEESGSAELQEVALQGLGNMAWVDGDPPGAIAQFEEQVRVLEEMGHAGRLPEADRLLAEALVATGDLERAEFHAQRAVDTVGADDWYTVGTSRLALGSVRDAQGREEEAGRLVREGREVIERTGFRPGLSQAYLAEAEFHLGHGREDEGKRSLEMVRTTYPTGEAGAPFWAHVERRVAAARRRAGERRVDGERR